MRIDSQLKKLRVEQFIRYHHVSELTTKDKRYIKELIRYSEDLEMCENFDILTKFIIAIERDEKINKVL